jgi:serine/threonine protein kinase/formylglycine-generating enzyme required for sulfatase activity
MSPRQSNLDRPSRLSELLQGGRSCSLADALQWIRELTLQVQKTHEGGRIHRAIVCDRVVVGEDLRAELLDPPETQRLGGQHDDAECCPPELAEADPVDVPRNAAEAARVLERCGRSMDPRRIDVYQLGALLCRLLTAEPVHAYLFSPVTKSKVPRQVRPLLDGMLGHDPAHRIQDCAQVLGVLREIAEEDLGAPASSPSDDTPPRGSTINVSADTPVCAQPAVPPSAASELPFARLGHFRIVGRIERGGMGDVYKGYDESLDRFVAIKVLPTELAQDEDFVRRFRSEAAAAANVADSNVVPVHFIGEDSGHHFFAMQYVDGESLAEHLRRQGALSVDRALEIAADCLAGLEAAHQKGTIHRDVKPGNVIVERKSGRAVLVDFGLAHLMGTSTRMTATGTIMGTVDYIAPEQARGQEIDGRADQYSLGVMLYELLSGRLPFAADSPTAMLFQHAYEPPFPLRRAAPDVPPAVVAIVDRMMAKAPADRYPSCAAVLEDIRAFRERRAVSAAAPSVEATATEIPPASDPLAGLPLPDVIARMVSDNRWQRVRDWAATMFRRHAPEIVKELRTTTQRVDGAVAEYERRRDRLARLHAEAQEIGANLLEQIDANREAVTQADARLHATQNADEKEAVLVEKRECEENLAALQTQHAEQLRNNEDLELELHKAEAALARLRSQRDLLKARLRSAEARQGRLSGRSRTKRRRWIAAAALTLGLLAAVSLWWRSLIGRPPTSLPSTTLPSTSRASTSLPSTPVEQAEKGEASGPAEKPAEPPAEPSPVIEAEANRSILTNSIGMKLVRVPAGKFMMGTSQAEMAALLADNNDSVFLKEGHQSDELPVHEVAISRPFYLGMYEVTQGEYVSVLGTDPSKFGPGSGGRGRYPVDGVTFDDACRFCRELTNLPAEKAAGRRYRLPTEAEWEYACRAGTTGAFNFHPVHTDHVLNRQGMNYAAPSAGASPGPETQKGTTIVGSYPSNGFGLYDMHGNVWEWCSDVYGPGDYRQSGSIDPAGPGEETGEHVIRGGAFDVPAVGCRSACRGHAKTTAEEVGAVGFRVVCELTEAADDPASAGDR